MEKKRSKEVGISKHLDRFMVYEHLLQLVDIHGSWVGTSGDVDHNPIFLMLTNLEEKPSSPLKFHMSGLEEEEFEELMKEGQRLFK